MKRVIAACVLLVGFVLLTAQGHIDDGGGPAGGGLGVSSTSNIVGGDTVYTDATEPFGATMVVYALRATTGACSSIVVSVSQNRTTWFTPAQDGSIITSVDGASVDSLANGPHTFVVHAKGANNVLIPIPYKYMRLRLGGETGTIISGLSVTATPVWVSGGADEMSAVYKSTW